MTAFPIVPFERGTVALSWLEEPELSRYPSDARHRVIVARGSARAAPAVAAPLFASRLDPGKVPDVRDDLVAEYKRLLEQTKTLQAEHARLEARPTDSASYREHRMQLREQIRQLRAHIRRLGQEA